MRLTPADPRAALDVRMMDRFFDHYVMTPMQKFVLDRLRPAEHRDPVGVPEARQMLDTAYCWLEEAMAGREWAAGNTFSMADCAAAPSLFYADWVYPIGPELASLGAPTGSGCSPALRSRARSTKRGPTVRCFRSARPIAIDRDARHRRCHGRGQRRRARLKRSRIGKAREHAEYIEQDRKVLFGLWLTGPINPIAR